MVEVHAAAPQLLYFFYHVLYHFVVKTNVIGQLVVKTPVGIYFKRPVFFQRVRADMIFKRPLCRFPAPESENYIKAAENAAFFKPALRALTQIELIAGKAVAGGREFRADKHFAAGKYRLSLSAS